MTQPNIQADGIRIEPGSGQTLTITRDAATGSLKFTDVPNPAGLVLSQLANMSTVQGTLFVGPGGAGAQYTSIQDAINAVPASVSLTNPYVIIVNAGVYTECLTITKPGITIVGVGRVVILPDSANPCITVQDDVATFPTSLTLANLVVTQPNNGLACVRLNGGAGSTVGANGIQLQDCMLLPTGVGGYTVFADTVNTVSLRNCQTIGVPVSASLRMIQCAALTVVGGSLPAVQADYNSAGVIPSVIGSAYSLSGCSTVGNVLSTLTGGGSLSIQSCPTVGTVTLNGDRTLTVKGSAVGNLTLNGTTAASLLDSSRGTAAGAGTLQEPQVSGSTTFVASALESVLFSVARPDSNYTVVLDTGIVATAYVTARTPTGFSITFVGPVSTTVYWTVLA